MKGFYTILMIAGLFMFQKTNAQLGPNLLGAKGTFSSSFVTPKTYKSSENKCPVQGNYTYNPVGNIGNPLNTLSGEGTAQPSSGYTYVYKSGGLQPEFTYTLIKNIGDANGFNCIKGDWKGQDHTGDGGYFMAVNGAPNSTKSPIFYRINTIQVCPGTQYEFSAWVINLLPASSPYAHAGSEPNISFKVTAGGVSSIIATSGPIAYQNTPTWVKVSGVYTVPENVEFVDLEVINATAVEQGNDLGLDDISFNVLQSNISVSGLGGELPNAVCEGSGVGVKFTVNDATQTNTWYKWQVSTDGGQNYTDSTAPAQATFSGDSYDLTLKLHNVSMNLNGKKYRLVVSTSQEGLASATCKYVNEYTLIVNDCAPVPVTLSEFSGKYGNGQAILDWQTSQEINSSRFEIQKSNDGQNFNYLASVNAAGFSTIPQEYSYTDKFPGGGTYAYYRLKQIDMDGKFTFSNVVKISLGNRASLEVFPNPFTSSFTANFVANKTAEATMIIRNSIGQSVMQKTIKTIKGNNSVNINNLSSLKPGIYYVNISNDDMNYNLKLQKQ